MPAEDPLVYYTAGGSHYHYTVDGCRAFQHGRAESRVHHPIQTDNESVLIRMGREVCSNCRDNLKYDCFCDGCDKLRT